MRVPIEMIEQSTLENLVREFVLRDVDNELNDVPFETKCAEVKQQLLSGDAIVVYSELYESVNIVLSANFK